LKNTAKENKKLLLEKREICLEPYLRAEKLVRDEGGRSGLKGNTFECSSREVEQPVKVLEDDATAPPTGLSSSRPWNS
jgi:hypothetical protein